MNNKRILFITNLDAFKPVEVYHNSGNMVWDTAGISFFYSNNLNTTFITFSQLERKLIQDKDWAKKNFDIAIQLQANIFCIYYNDVLKSMAKIFEMLQIPIYVFGAGAQGRLDYSMESLDAVKTDAKRYIDAILQTGGTITLRGNFTKELLNKWGGV